MAVLADQAHLRIFSLLTKLLRRVYGEKHSLRLRPVGTIFFVVKLDQPRIVVLNDKVASLGHGHLLLRIFGKGTPLLRHLARKTKAWGPVH
jgi:hypothetical protein